VQLAYVFWHWPAGDADRAAYEDRLREFHAALGLDRSRTFRLDRAPWDDPRPEPYEDWYPVAGWEQLGALNERAVSGARRAPHDAAAAAAGDGAGGVYRLIGAAADGASTGGAPPSAGAPAAADAAAAGAPGEPVTRAHWLAKPAGLAYDDFLPALLTAARGGAVWQRQMVLGPAPEFAVLGLQALALPWPATLTAPRSL
jgi:hypothetical protein